MIYHFKPYERAVDEIGLSRSRYMDLLNAEARLEDILENEQTDELPNKELGEFFLFCCGKVRQEELDQITWNRVKKLLSEFTTKGEEE